MRPHHCLAVLALAVTAVAQDMIGVSWSGQMYAFDSFQGGATLLGNGLPGQNASARDDHGRIWATANGNALSVLDPSVPAASTPLPSLTADLRGLANGGAQFLWGIENGPVDVLVRIDKVVGTRVTMGATGFTNIEALANHNYQLYVWDLNQGLLRVNPNTGVATDVNPAVGGAGTPIYWLSTRSDGKLIGGQNNLYEVDTTTGVATLFASLGPVDLRGADAWQSFTRPFGSTCNGAGGPVALTAQVTGTSSKLLTIRSTNHAPNRLGASIFGLSTSHYASGLLPLALDPLLGTVGCTLFTGSDASLLGVTTASAPATLDFQYTFPPLNDLYTFYVQHITLEPVPGGLAASNGVIVQLGH